MSISPRPELSPAEHVMACCIRCGSPAKPGRHSVVYMIGKSHSVVEHCDGCAAHLLQVTPETQPFPDD